MIPRHDIVVMFFLVTEIFEFAVSKLQQLKRIGKWQGLLLSQNVQLLSPEVCLVPIATLLCQSGRDRPSLFVVSQQRKFFAARIARMTQRPPLLVVVLGEMPLLVLLFLSLLVCLGL